MQVYESCHSTWVFDPVRMRFRRILRLAATGARQGGVPGPGAHLRGGHAVSTSWRPYYGLDVDADGESFTVLLNADGTRLIRSWRHTADCTQCGAHVTAQLSLDELAGALRR